MSIIKDDKAFLPILGWIIGSLFVIVIMVAYASYILAPITAPIINATATEHQDVGNNAVSKGYGGIALSAVALPIALVVGYFIYLVITNWSYEQ